MSALPNSDLGEALGKSYVEEAFGGQSKQRVLSMVHAIEQALQGDIQELSWMTPETKKQALIKLAGGREQDWLSGQVARL